MTRPRDHKAEYARRPPRPRRNGGYGRWDLLTWYALGERILTRDELGAALLALPHLNTAGATATTNAPTTSKPNPTAVLTTEKAASAADQTDEPEEAAPAD